jgi:hypothetical protein
MTRLVNYYEVSEMMRRARPTDTAHRELGSLVNYYEVSYMMSLAR